jgi:hypothetical protein
VALDEGSSGGSRITSQGRDGGDQELTALKASMFGTVVHDTELGCGLCSLRSGLGPCGSVFISPSNLDTDDTGRRESEPIEVSRGMY